MSDKQICCLCGNPFEEFGNNPYPLESSSKLCCDRCNMMYVIPARIKSYNDDLRRYSDLTPDDEVRSSREMM